jgi:hypothetical protein
MNANSLDTAFLDTDSLYAESLERRMNHGLL